METDLEDRSKLCEDQNKDRNTVFEFLSVDKDFFQCSNNTICFWKQTRGVLPTRSSYFYVTRGGVITFTYRQNQTIHIGDFVILYCDS